MCHGCSASTNAAATPAPGCPHARSRQARRITAAIEASNAGTRAARSVKSLRFAPVIFCHAVMPAFCSSDIGAWFVGFW